MRAGGVRRGGEEKREKLAGVSLTVRSPPADECLLVGLPPATAAEAGAWRVLAAGWSAELLSLLLKVKTSLQVSSCPSAAVGIQVCLPALQQVYKLEQIRQSPIFVYFVFQLELKNVINDYELIVDC